MDGWLTDIILRLQIDEESKNIEPYPSDNSGRYWSLEGVNKIDGVEERCFIYDCSEADYEFDYESYNRYMNDEEDVARAIIVFRNWDHEQNIKRIVFNQLANAADKRKFMSYFEKKESVYTELGSQIRLKVEDKGVNYLSYEIESSDAQIEIVSRIYNLSFAELKKVFNVTGQNLFRKNVRLGLKNSKGLKEAFQEYIKIGAYQKWISENEECQENKIVKSLFGIETEDLFIKSPKSFWLLHNGVTFFYYGETPINFSGSYIELNPREVSVINGAQTVKNFFEGMNELLEDFKQVCKEEIEEEIRQKKIIDFLEEYINVASSQIYVKAIFIAGDEKYVQPITYGLNTQLPIMETDIIADSDEVTIINRCLKRRKMKILKGGETPAVGIGFSVLEFIKKYLILKEEPGTSKNLRRSEIKRYIKEVRELVQDDESSNEFLKKLSDVVLIEQWWKKNKKKRMATYTDKIDLLYCNHGVNYFQSYVLSEKTEELDEGYLEILLNNFLQEFRNLTPEPEIKDFKSNILFESYKHKKESKSENSLIEYEINCDELRDKLNSKKPSAYSVYKVIMDYLKEENVELNYFRVIARSNQKVREAFPFPNSTFNELYQDTPSEEMISKDSYKSFEESTFAKEVKKEYPVFVIEWTVKDDLERVASKVDFIKKFSFKEYENDAKKVYEDTVNAFVRGDETEFPKTRSDISFHIRPKAIDASDTFEFSNGKHITKRTFWANKKTIEKILEKVLEKEE